MKVLDFEKTIASLQELKKFLPGRDGTSPGKWLTKENVDYLVRFLDKKAIEVDTTPDTGGVESHSEMEIVKGCIALMQQLTGRFEDYLDFIGNAPDDEEGFATSFSYFEIVQRLLLWKTHHSGGTSTIEKCRELGFDSSDTVIFEDERGKEDDGL